MYLHCYMHHTQPNPSNVYILSEYYNYSLLYNCRDWRGLASLANISTEQASSIKTYSDKTSEVLYLWVRKNDGRANVGYLLQYLQWLDRYDVHDDLLELAREDKLIGV